MKRKIETIAPFVILVALVGASILFLPAAAGQQYPAQADAEKCRKDSGNVTQVLSQMLCTKSPKSRT